MKFKNTLLILLFLLITFISISSAVAIENNNDYNNLTKYSNDLNLINIEESDNDILSENTDEKILSDVKNIDENDDYHREMSDHTIRDAISSANAGDTIIVNGGYYDHVHVVIDKQLVIKSNVGTKLSHCSNSGDKDSGHQGIFYLTSKASGTIIEGFNFINDDGMLGDSEGYGILINGASDVIIRNCTFSNGGIGDAIRFENSKNSVIQDISISDSYNGIKIKNSDAITVKNSDIQNSNCGIYDENSAKTEVTSNEITNNNVGIEIAGTSNNPTISFNNLTYNENAISLLSSETINILSNYIAENTAHGVYVNCKIKKINIIGNFFYKNNLEEVFNDINTKGFYVQGGENLEVVNNNYFIGLENRPVQRASSVGGGVFLQYAFEINTNVACPIIYSTYGVQWAVNNYRLQLSEITQSKKGVYSISIVDANGNVAKGLSSVPVTFYLNKNNNLAAPQEGDVYKTVMLQDGTATVRFYPQDFKESGNVVTAVLPGSGNYLTSDQNKNVKTFNVDDSKIPGEVIASKLIISDLTTYPNSNAVYTISLKDINGNPISKEPITVTLNSKEIKLTTDVNGQVSIKISEKTGTYVLKVTYAGDDIEWAPVSAQSKITVKKESVKIKASNYAMFIKKADYYKIILKDSKGNPLAKEKLTVTVNKKTYNLKTDAKGAVKIRLKLKKGTYKVKITYKGSNIYAAAKLTKKITVKKILKSKLNAPKITVLPKKSVRYSVTLKDQNGKAIKKQKITVKVNGKKYTKKTNSKGQVTVKVKFSKIKTYKVKVTYKGSKKYKKSSASGKITVKKQTASKPVSVVPEVKPGEENIKTQIILHDRTFSKNSTDDYFITLKDSSGNTLTNHEMIYTVNNQQYLKNTDVNGQVKVDISDLKTGSYTIKADFTKTGIYEASSASAVINILNTQNISYVDEGWSNDEIQKLLDATSNSIVFLSGSYNDVSLKIDRALNITFDENIVLNGKSGGSVLTVSVSNFTISNLIINANEGSGIIITNADNVTVKNNTVLNTLDKFKSDKYLSGELIIPGNGVELINANNVSVTGNDIKSFGNAVFAENSGEIQIKNNTLSLSSYGINYGLGVKNTNISDNLICKNIGLYVMDVPEGPSGYGIFLNRSAVNVSITNNKILDNYMGISVDANYSTGIVILYNWISDNALEGIRFNAGYDLAENAVEPDVNDNAIYRNAKGPSMMILGELSANPEGRYHYGEFNDTERLQLGTNWYGKNARITWDYATNTTGYGTMCPRIATTYISVKEIEVVESGIYQLRFFKGDEVASKLPDFEMYATLNDEEEVNFTVVDGIGIFSFDSGYKIGDNKIKVSIGSLKDEYRTFEVLLNKNIEITS